LPSVTAGVDIGGTFTDIVALVESDDEPRLIWTKVPSTPRAPAEAVLASLEIALARAGVPLMAVKRFMHATTVGTNAVLEQKGAKIAILATDGFEDTLETGRQKRSQLYDLFLEPETPVFLCPAERRVAVQERVAGDGTVLAEIDEPALRETLALLESWEVDAVAVVYLFSFQNPAHELRTRDIVLDKYPELSVSLSHEVSPVFREYERTCVTAFDAYLRPVMGEYLTDLQAKLRDAGMQGSIQTMKSRGGLASLEGAIDRPVTTMLSGPAAGVIGARFIGRAVGIDNVITLDMGGTSADVAVIRADKAIMSTQGGIGRYPLNVPMVDVQTIGAGGGSIAWLDSAAGLRVGPQSAGSDPGPACYGRGGTAPTVTDASVVLGYLDPTARLGEGNVLDFDRALAAIERVAEPLGMTAVEAALGIHRIVNAKMADAIRLASVKRGYDPRLFDLMAFGGAGPVHGGALAIEMGMSRCIAPRSPGVLSALGLLVSDVEYDNAQTHVRPLRFADVAEIERVLDALRERGLKQMAIDGHSKDECLAQYSADMRYVGQSSELEVPLSFPLDDGSLLGARERFVAEHDRVYGYGDEKAEVEIVNLRALVVRVPDAEIAASLMANFGESADSIPLKGHRECWFDEDGSVKTPVFDRTVADGRIDVEGPAIVQQEDTTVVVYPSFRCRTGSLRNLVMEISR